MKPRSAFTLIELLIVVAIIAILAAIAVPNFLEAQARSKVSRAKSDLRALATGMEAYAVDQNSYPPDMEGVADAGQAGLIPYQDYANGQFHLTSPVAYLTSAVHDPFDSTSNSVGTVNVKAFMRIGSGSWSHPAGISPKDKQDSTATMAAHGPSSSWVALSVGPDGKRARCSYKCFPWKPGTDTDAKPGDQPSFYVDYDPTNGSVSVGDILRFGGNFMDGDWERNGHGAGHQGLPN